MVGYITSLFCDRLALVTASPPHTCVGHGTVNSGNRGRDTHYWAPPAQIRTCRIPAYGSYLGCLTAKRCSGHG